METENKEEYIKAWTNHINELRTLQFTKDRELSEQVAYHIEKLNELVVQIADTKKFEVSE